MMCQFCNSNAEDKDKSFMAKLLQAYINGPFIKWARSCDHVTFDEAIEDNIITSNITREEEIQTYVAPIEGRVSTKIDSSVDRIGDYDIRRFRDRRTIIQTDNLEAMRYQSRTGTVYHTSFKCSQMNPDFRLELPLGTKFIFWNMEE